ncbi:hypothetical protein VTN77DRAFT_1394 [Rasamsonia byssochlamydoides]|uniref:uncharacterized protein n=1 Tax=Rasamsonia byssochlamydoides TaxID=89139 RepID=UPI003742EA2F
MKKLLKRIRHQKASGYVKDVTPKDLPSTSPNGPPSLAQHSTEPFETPTGPTDPSSRHSSGDADPALRESESLRREGNIEHGAIVKKDYWQLAVNKFKKDEPSLSESLAAVQNAAAAVGPNFAENLLHAAKEAHDKLLEKRWKFKVLGQEGVPPLASIQSMLASRGLA